MPAKKSTGKKMPANPRGRSSTYTEAVAGKICEQLAAGKSLDAICRAPGMPQTKTVRKWLLKEPKFATDYASAREAQAEHYAAEIVQIADTCTDPNKARLQIDARKWYASKVAPKSFGDKLDITQTNRVAPMSNEQMTEEMRQSPAYRREIEEMLEKSAGS